MGLNPSWLEIRSGYSQREKTRWQSRRLWAHLLPWRDLGLIPGLGRTPGEGKGYPLQYSGLENSMQLKELDRGLQRVGKGCKELDTTECLSLHFTSSHENTKITTNCWTIINRKTGTYQERYHTSEDKKPQWNGQGVHLRYNHNLWVGYWKGKWKLLDCVQLFMTP